MADDVVEELQESLSKFVSVAFGGARIKALLILTKAHYIFLQCTEKPNTHLILVAVQKCVSSGKWTRLLECLTRSDHKVCEHLFTIDKNY